MSTRLEGDCDIEDRRDENNASRGTVERVERIVQVFSCFEEAETADDEFYARLTPEERLDILLELVERHRSALGESGTRFERVYRIIELSQS